MESERIKELLERQLTKNSIIRMFASAELELAEEALNSARESNDIAEETVANFTVKRLKIILDCIENSDADIVFELANWKE